MITYPIAPTPEGAACEKAQGIHATHAAEWEYRVENLHRVSDPIAAEREAAYLARRQEALRAELQRLLAWRYDLHRRQVAAGVLIPAADGTCTLRRGVDVRGGRAGQVAGQVAARAASGFARTQFRSKFGIAGLLLVVAAIGMYVVGLGDLASLIGVPGFVALIVWFLMGVMGVGISHRSGHGGGGGYQSRAHSMQVEAMRAQAARDAAAESVEQEAKAAADARRAAAIRRAAERAQASAEEWG